MKKLTRIKREIKKKELINPERIHLETRMNTQKRTLPRVKNFQMLTTKNLSRPSQVLSKWVILESDSHSISLIDLDQLTT